MACWKGQLHAADAIALESSTSFFHVAPIPKISKLAPGLVQRLKSHNEGDTNSMNRLVVHPLAYSRGLTVFFDKSSSQNERTALTHQWINTQFGLTVASSTGESFNPAAWVTKMENFSPSVDESLNGQSCSSILSANVQKEYTGVGSLLLKLKPFTEDEAVDACFIAALLHLASFSEVAGLEVTERISLKGLPNGRNSGSFPSWKTDQGRKLRSSTGDVRALNYIAVTALQSGNANQPYPFWRAGINGSNQFVQVTDTGFDDASCFLRDTDASKSLLKGPFNSNVQLERSTYDNPITDFSRRKIVQYIAVSNSSDSYEYDYKDGHGTHVAGTVAGRLASDGNSVAIKYNKDNFYDCSENSAYCDTLFCATCPYANDCDETCRFLDNEDFTGMAPSAKIMVRWSRE